MSKDEGGGDIMDINKSENLIYKLCNLQNEELNNIEVSFNLVRKQSESDNFFQSLEVQLAPDVQVWLRDHIIKNLNLLRQEDDLNNKVFMVGDYNHEIRMNDKIAKFALDGDLLEKKNKLISALRDSDTEYPENRTNFQITKLKLGNNAAYFCFYRGTKKNTSKKRFAIKNSNQFQFIETTIIDMGGSFDFFILDDHIFILNVTSFEYAFDYRDHINQLRDQNLTQIVSMPFFEDDGADKAAFVEACSKFFYSRGLAQIKPQTISAIQSKFEERCIELALIRSSAPENEQEKKEYIEKFGTLWDLFDYIDVEHYKVKYEEGNSPKPLIHFFADKIVKSFLTEDIKIATSYE
jgi:hypothetical protein